MKASKKYLAFLAFLLILLMVPQKGYAAVDYSGGWLDGYYVGYCLSEDGFYRPVIPDYRKDSGMFSMTGRTGYGGDQGRAIANLVEPATVRAIRLNANNALSVASLIKMVHT